MPASDDENAPREEVLLGGGAVIMLAIQLIQHVSHPQLFCVVKAKTWRVGGGMRGGCLRLGLLLGGATLLLLLLLAFMARGGGRGRGRGDEKRGSFACFGSALAAATNARDAWRHARRVMRPTRPCTRMLHMCVAFHTRSPSACAFASGAMEKGRRSPRSLGASRSTSPS